MTKTVQIGRFLKKPENNCIFSERALVCHACNNVIMSKSDILANTKLNTLYSRLYIMCKVIQCYRLKLFHLIVHVLDYLSEDFH